MRNGHKRRDHDGRKPNPYAKRVGTGELLSWALHLATNSLLKGIETPKSEERNLRDSLALLSRDAMDKFRSRTQMRFIRGEFDRIGTGAGYQVIRLLFGWRNAEMMAAVRSLSEAVGYEIKEAILPEYSALVQFTDRWLEFGDGQSLSRDKRWIRALADKILSPLTRMSDSIGRKIGYERKVIRNESINRWLKEVLPPAPSVDDVVSDAVQDILRASVAWKEIQTNPIPLDELPEIREEIRRLERELRIVEMRVTDRFVRTNRKKRELSDQERDYVQETRNRIGSLKRGTERTWTEFEQTGYSLVCKVLSAMPIISEPEVKNG